MRAVEKKRGEDGELALPGRRGLFLLKRHFTNY